MAQLKSTNVTGNLSVTGNILASKIIKFGGTADEILCADGSTTTLSGLGAGTVTSVTVTGNNGLTGTGTITSSGTITLSHDDTSDVADLTATDRTYVKSLTFDSYGHVTGYTTGAETVTSYFLPLAANGTRGGIQIGYSSTENNRAVSLSSEKAYIALPSRLYAGRTDSTAPDAATNSGFYYSSSFPASVGFGSNQGTMFVSSYDKDWVAQIAIGCYTNKMIFRKKGTGWSDWETVATESWVTNQLGTSGSFDLSKYTEGAASSTDNAIVRFDGTGGKKIQNSTAIISDAGHLTINTTADTTMTTPAIHVLHTGPVDAYKTADLMILSGYSGAPYGFKFSTHGSGTAIIQSQRISGGQGEKFSLSLNPDGGDVLMNGKLIATQDWVTEQIGSGSSGSNSEYAKFLKPQNTATSDGASQWGGGSETQSGWVSAWSQRFKRTDNDGTGDIHFWLRNASATNAELCIMIDGDYYGSTGNKRVAYVDEIKNSQITIATSGDGLGLSSDNVFTLNQGSNETITLKLDSAMAGNRSEKQVVIAAAKGQINSEKYAITDDGTTVKATWRYNSSTDCVELVWA